VAQTRSEIGPLGTSPYCCEVNPRTAVDIEIWNDLPIQIAIDRKADDGGNG
jgi:hypothetical protein